MSAQQVQISYVATTSAKLSQLPIVNGQLIICTDTGKQYVDFNNERLVSSSSVSTACYDESTALYAHAINDFIFMNDHFYKVTSAIAVGDTIAVGTNVTATLGLSVGDPIFVQNIPDGFDYRVSNRDLIAALNRIYPCRDLTQIYADEISDYSDEWAWIQARLNAHNVDGLLVGDYIPITVGSENHKAQIAGINTYYDNSTNIKYHIDWVTMDCYGGATVTWNTTANNNGNSSESSPILASNLQSWLESTLYPLLATKLKTAIKPKRMYAPTRYVANSTFLDDNGLEWISFSKLWVPFEFEVADTLVNSTKGYGNTPSVQYPLFANSCLHRIKKIGPSGNKTFWWTASAKSGSSTDAVVISSAGHSISNATNTAGYVPVCFRTMEATS